MVAGAICTSRRKISTWVGVALVCVAAGTGAAVADAQAQSKPELVHFKSADGKTTLDGYLYRSSKSSGRVPAIVMMHGRAGLYSINAKGRFDAETLTRRHKMWGEFWSARGYVALLVDSFGPRGHVTGFQKGTYEDRPTEISEVTVRPLDAAGALQYLRSRSDVIGDRVALQGWSNGGSATLATMGLGPDGSQRNRGFRLALAFYPACGLQGRFDKQAFRPYAPVRMFHGTADEEVSFPRCKAFVEKSKSSGGDIEIQIYQDATHDFDDPSSSRQSNPANARAIKDAMSRAERLAAQYLQSAPTPTPSPIPAKSDVTVTKDVDVYDARGGTGKKTAILRAGTPNAQLLENRAPWFRLRWPAGSGWVYSGAGYLSLRLP